MPDGAEMPVSDLSADLLPLTVAALPELDALLAEAMSGLRAAVTVSGRVSGAALEADQFAAHSLSWLATYVESLRQMQAWAAKLQAEGRFGEMEQLLLQIGFGEYLSQIAGGIPMSQGETARLQDLRVTWTPGPAAARLMAAGNTPAARTRLVALMRENHGRATFGATGLDDELEMIRDQFRRYADERVVPNAHGWHLRDELIPMEIIEELSELGVFGLTIPEEFGGLGLSKASMVVVSEELSRGYIGVGSLATRSEIAAELILCGGTPEQKAQWLPKLASGEILPTAVFTEPNTGSDLGSLRTRAVREGDDWTVTGNKTWITHAARTHVMTLLARTDPETTDYRGLSMFLAEKTPGTDEIPFPTPGMTGGEIEVLGYRGMKEYELGFDGFKVKGENLLGGVPGQGFKQSDADLRIRPHPDCGPRRGRGAGGAGGRDAICARPQAVRQGADRVSARVGQAGDDGGGNHGGAAADLSLRLAEGPRQALRSGGRDGQASGRPRCLGRGRQCPADPRWQRLCAGIHHQPDPLRCAYPQHLRGRGRDPGAGDRPPPARRRQLSLSGARPALGAAARPAPRPPATRPRRRRTRPPAGPPAAPPRLSRA
ncbi:Crotonobetainyl-CoA reductase [Frigidibacter albus]